MTQQQPAGRESTRIVVAHRGDALVPHLEAALAGRYERAGVAHTELTRAERLLVAASTVRPVRRLWAERFFKSNLAVGLRSRRAERALSTTTEPFDAIMQVHALFELSDARTTIYVDCTHQQSMQQWPDWNPLRGRALRVWLARERRQYHAASHVFAFSAEARDSLVDDYGLPRGRVSVVGAGVNFDHLPEAVPGAWGESGASARPRSSEHRTILFVGNDFVRKGGPALVAAFRLVRERVPEARLQIVGTTHRIAPQDGLEVLGRVSGREAMSRLYRDAAVFCLPSFFDPFPLVVLEAMAHGLPVVASPANGVPEMVLDGQTGLLIDHGPDEITELAEALVQILEQPSYGARLGAAGRRRVEERFLWEHVVERMAPTLDRMSRRSRSTIDRSAATAGADARSRASLSSPTRPSRNTYHPIPIEGTRR